MKRLWVHEVLRVYGDRLVDNVDVKWLIEQIRKTLLERMDEDMNELFTDFLNNESIMVMNMHLCTFNYPLIYTKSF